MDYDHAASKCFFVYGSTGFKQWDFPKAGDEIRPGEQAEEKNVQKSSLPTASQSQLGGSSAEKNETAAQATENPVLEAAAQDQNGSDQDNPQAALKGNSTTCTTQTTVEVPPTSGHVENQPNPAPVFVYPNPGSPQSGSSQPPYVLPASAPANFVQGGVQPAGQTPQYYVIQAPQNGTAELTPGVQPPPYSAIQQKTTQPAGSTEPGEQTAEVSSLPDSERPSQELVQSPTETEPDADQSSLQSSKSSKRHLKWASKKLKKTVSKTESIIKATADKTGTIVKTTADKTGTIVKTSADRTETMVKATAEKTGTIVKTTADKAGEIVKATADRTESVVKTTAEKSGNVVKGTLSNPATKFVGSAVVEVAGLHFGIVGASAVVNHSIAKLTGDHNQNSAAKKGKGDEGKGEAGEKTETKHDSPTSPQASTPQAEVETQVVFAVASGNPQQQVGTPQQLISLPQGSPQQDIVQPQPSSTMNAQVQSPAASVAAVQPVSQVEVSVGTASSSAIPVNQPQTPTEATVQFQQIQIPSQLATPPGESGGGGYFVLHAGGQLPQHIHMPSFQSFNAQFAGAGGPLFVNAACMPGVIAPQTVLTPPASPPAMKEQEKPAAAAQGVAAPHSSAQRHSSFFDKLARTITAPAILESVVDVEIGNLNGDGNVSAEISGDVSSFIS